MMPPGNEATAPAQGELTATQLTDLATILARLGREKILWIADSILGKGGSGAAGDAVGDLNLFAAKIVEALTTSGRIPEAVKLLSGSARLSVDLEYVLRGGSLEDAAARQAFTNEVEPFFNSLEFEERHMKFKRMVCAIGLAGEYNEIRGSGFLIGPDLVITNAHVLGSFLTSDPAGLVQNPKVSGDDIVCFFDYFSAPMPRIPPQQGKQAFLAVTAKKDDWLVHAREPLPGEGTDRCPNDAASRYDYAVIRLSRKIGNLPAQNGGGPSRGWVPLPDDVDVIPARRVILYQHPGEAPQQFDIGEYVTPDCTQTRVRYTVSTAHGSSGGAAVDANGELFALHTAEVIERQPGGRKLNQGVKIDLIASDLLASRPELKDLPSPEERPFWSLSDDLSDPQPVIGRAVFRDNVLDLHRNPNVGTTRVLAVTGPAGSGLGYSEALLQRTLGLDVRVVSFGADDLAKLRPREFLASLASKLSFWGFQESEIPPEDPKADLPRWLDGDLPNWLAARLEREVQRDPRRYPAWVVLNTAVDKFKWPYLMPELLAALAGAHDVGKAAVPMPHLRFLYLAFTADSIPSMPGVQILTEDLKDFPSYAEDFYDCLYRALYTIDRNSEIGDFPNWKFVIDQWVNNVDVPLRRKVLAEQVKALFLYRTKGQGV